MANDDPEYTSLREELVRCSPETIEAAIRYQTGRDPADVPKIVFGILDRYLPQKSVGALTTATAETRLIEDLGMDSMTLLEVVMTAEIVFGIRIANEELKDILTIGRMEEFIRRKVAADGA